MNPPARRARILGIAVAMVLSLGACNGGSGTDAAGASPASSPTLEPVLDAGAVATTAGPLTGRQMPAPAVIGPGWTERADPGSNDEGNADPNAPSTQQRNVDELMDGLVPIGCPDAAVNIPLPRPQFALERTYGGPSGEPGVALVLEFADSTTPGGFLDALERQVRACPAAKTDPNGPVTLQFTRVRRSPAQISAVRQESGPDADPSRYLLVAVRDGKRVALVFLAGVPAAKAATIGADLISSIRKG